VLEPKDVVCVVTSDARALICKADELPELANPGRGVTVIKAGAETVVGFGVGRAKDKDVLIAETDDGKELPVGPGRFSVTSRGGKGHALKRKTKIARVTSAEPLAPPAPPALLN
jgi:DNA gyrase subunit A